MRPVNEMIDELVTSIRRICKEKNITISQMENDLGFSPGLISRWNKTKTSPSFDKIVSIKNYLNVTFDELMSGVVQDEMADNIGSGYSNDKAISEKLLKDSESGRMKWLELSENEPFYVSSEEIFPDWKEYRFHVIYYTSFASGYFFIALQYHDRTLDMNVELYSLAKDGFEPKQIRGEESILIKLLKYADNELYTELNKKETENMEADYLVF